MQGTVKGRKTIAFLPVRCHHRPIFVLAATRSCRASIRAHQSRIASVSGDYIDDTIFILPFFRHSLKQEREKNIVLNRKLLDHYFLTNTSDLQILPVDINHSGFQSQSSFLSPTQSLIVPQQHGISTPNDHSRILLIHSPNTPRCCTNLSQTANSPGSHALKQQIKLAGSNMFRYYSSII